MMISERQSREQTVKRRKREKKPKVHKISAAAESEKSETEEDDDDETDKEQVAIADAETTEAIMVSLRMDDLCVRWQINCFFFDSARKNLQHNWQPNCKN